MSNDIQKPTGSIGGFESGGLAVIDEAPTVVEESKPEIVDPDVPKTLALLLEVGCEEIPARFLRDAEKGLGERVEAALCDARLMEPPVTRVIVESADPRWPSHESAPRRRGGGSLTTYSTPRRLVVHVRAVLAQQPDKVEEILGPPVKVAIDAGGNFTRAAESFAQKNGASLEDLTRTSTPKGEYLSLQKTTPGRPAREILAETLPGAILGLTFPKSMYWTEKSAPRFVRPIRWVVALLGEGEQAATLDFEVLGVRTGNSTFGHRAKSRHAIPVRGFKEYRRKLRQAHVEIDYSERTARVVKEAQKVLAGDPGGKVVQDDWLVDWIANSTEWPRPMLGSFDARFLHLPREILITVMRDHQRYFAVENPQGNLAPHFVAVLNMESDEKGLIRQGHQRVLTARFRDAEFFWHADQKISLPQRIALLEKVTYQAKLGSYGNKIRRMNMIAENICSTLEAAGGLKEGERDHVLRALELSKCDLTTQMVQEFTELQGVVGGLYAQAQGEPEGVATAIYDHYFPLGAEGASPRTLVGAIASIADKVDSVVAGFSVGNEPTGSSDPFALRRQANAIIKVILERGLALSLTEMVDIALAALASPGNPSARPAEAPVVSPISAPQIAGGKGSAPCGEVRPRVLEFFSERLRFYLETVRRFRYDTVRAVIAAGSDRPTDALARAEAMEALRGGEDFEALSAAAKRIRNILAKSASAADWEAGEVAPALLAEPQERALAATYFTVVGEVERWRQQREYRRALEVISTLRPVVDRFFDKVLVMAEDRELRQNRLRLLKKLDELFSGIAHFAEIEGQ